MQVVEKVFPLVAKGVGIKDKNLDLILSLCKKALALSVIICSITQFEILFVRPFTAPFVLH